MAAEILVILIVHKSYHFMFKIRNNDCLNSEFALAVLELCVSARNFSFHHCTVVVGELQ